MTVNIQTVQLIRLCARGCVCEWVAGGGAAYINKTDLVPYIL